MAQVKVFYDRVGNTLTVWFGEPQDEYGCEETGDKVILSKLCDELCPCGVSTV